MENKIEELINKTLVDIKQTNDEIYFETSEGDIYKMYHSQDCCEQVNIDDIVGDLDDLIGSPITMAEESTSNDAKTTVYDEGTNNEWSYTDESATWTFYRLATIKGYVNIKWYGSSNGYYSESVDFIKID